MRYRSLAWGLIGILTFQTLLGLYASALNELFYARFGPFFDSLSYYNSIANMQIAARERGAFAAFVNASYSSTIVYPWLVFAPFANWAEPVRFIGTWIQIFSATIMQIFILFYFYNIQKRQLPVAFVYSATFVLIAAAFFYNGGLADFRMDLLQYILFATTMAIYLIARRIERLGWWALLGVSAGLVCLGRATTPVYLAPIFLVLAAVDLVENRSHVRPVLLRWLVAGMSAMAVSGWYFVSNFDNLYYYYVVWNEDANARLPLAESVVHLEKAAKHIGLPLGVALAAVCCISVYAAITATGGPRLVRINWRPLLFTVVPLGYLVLSGSGLNPFVSITGIAGIIMFLLDPVGDERGVNRDLYSVPIVALLISAGLVNASSGISQNTTEAAPWLPRQAAIRAVTQSLIDEIAVAPGPRKFRYAFVPLGALNDPVIFNGMYFDQHLPHQSGYVALLGENQLAPTEIRTNPGTAVEWATLPGTTDQEKIAGVVRYLGENADFIVTQTPESKLNPYVYVNRFVPDINRGIEATGQWRQIAGPVQVNSDEIVAVYRNTRRSGDPL